jgi:hypothetical protein
MFETLNPTTKLAAYTSHDDLEEKSNIFGVGEFVEESFQTFFIRKLSLFMRLSIPFSPSINPFVWWHKHEGQFPNVAF